MVNYYSKSLEFIFNLSIIKKMFYGISLIVIIITISSGYISYSFAHKIYIKRVFENASMLVQELNRSLEKDIGQIERIITSIYADTKLINRDYLSMKRIISSKNYSSLTEQYRSLLVANDFFNQLLYLREDFLNVYIYISKEKVFSYSVNGKNLLDYDPTVDDWYRKTVAANGKTLIFPPHKPFQLNDKSDVISFSKLLKNIDNTDRDPYGVILIDLSLRRIEQAIENSSFEKPARVLFFDKDNSIIYSQNLLYSKEDIEDLVNNKINGADEGKFITTISDEKYLIAYKTSIISGWKLLIVTPYRKIVKEWRDIFFIYIFLTIVAIFISAVISYIFSRSLYKPISAILKGIAKVEKGDFHSIIEYESKDELGQLANSFNSMVVKTRTLILERYEEKLARTDAEFKYLQAQINPHFIYNTLQIISSMAIVHKIPEINDISKDLARIMRYGIPSNSGVVSVKDEITNVSSYLDIQKIRFKDFFNYTITLSEEVYEYSIVKLILQPIVENSIIHGLNMRESGGIVKISVEIVNGLLFIEIWDNGIGISQVDLNTIMVHINESEEPVDNHRDRNSHNHVGLRNINRRIKILYGEESTFEIESIKEQWTNVKLVIPAVKNQVFKNYDKNSIS